MKKTMNIEDYLLWRGDYTFAQEPFNTLDALVFGELAYVNFGPAGLTEAGSSMRLQEAGKKMLESGQYELKTLYGGQKEFFQLACESKRFGNVIVRHCVDIFDESKDVQFAAAHFQYGPGETFVGFRGTDASLTGWKEDFMITFTQTRSQYYAAVYLDASMEENMNYIIGGHSKGGNLAMYAAVNIPEEKQAQLKHLYVLDAPGFAPDVYSPDKLKKFYDRTTRVMPEFCIISKIYEIPFPDTLIAASSASTTAQHDLITWQVYGPRLKTVEKNSWVSNAVMETVMKWAVQETIENRKTFVNEVFDALSAGGAKDITKVTRKGFLRVLEALARTSPETRTVALDLGRILIGAEPEGGDKNA